MPFNPWPEPPGPPGEDVVIPIDILASSVLPSVALAFITSAATQFLHWHGAALSPGVAAELVRALEIAKEAMRRPSVNPQ